MGAGGHLIHLENTTFYKQKLMNTSHSVHYVVNFDTCGFVLINFLTKDG